MVARVTAVLFFILLIWGNLVAGMQAGMACPDWPLCQGKFLPPMRVDVWMEFMHRVIAAAATIFLLLLARQRLSTYRGLQRGIPLTALGLIVLEIALGGIVVLLGLPVQVTTVHFMIGLAVFLLVIYMAACDGVTRPVEISLAGYAGLFFCVIALIYFQASLGAYVRHSASGLACPDFPTCQGHLIPVFWDSFVATQFSHRVVALATLCTALALAIASLLDQRLKQRQVELHVLAFLVAVQIAVGAAVVKSGLSYKVTSLHLAMTLAIIALTLRIWLLQGREAGGAGK
jgi:heme a synthase